MVTGKKDRVPASRRGHILTVKVSQQRLAYQAAVAELQSQIGGSE